MKKSTLSFLLSVITFCINAQVKDTVYSENKVNGTWVKNGLNILTMNQFCSVSTDLFQAWDEGIQSFKNSSLSTNNFDANGTVTGSLNQNWDAINNQWINSGRVSYTFSADGSNFTLIAQSWDAVNNAWIDSYRILTKYNPDGTTHSSEFDYSDGVSWLPQARNFNAYDDQKRVISFLYQAYTNNMWVNNSKATYDYSGKGLSSSYYWDSFSNQWIKSLRSFNKYLSPTALTTKQLYQGYTGVNWENQSRYTTDYNANNMLTKNSGELWDASLNNWFSFFRAAIAYYDDGSQHVFRYENWDVVSNSWNSGYRATYTNNACGTVLEFTPPVEVSNNKATIFDANRYGINPVLQSKNAGSNISRNHNLQMSNGKTSVYDFTYTSGAKQYAFSITTKHMIKHTIAKAAYNSNIIVQGNNKVRISPNPARNYFTADLTSYKKQGTVLLKLTDLSGRNMMQQTVKAGSMQNISLPYLQKGTYLVTIIAGKEIFTQKLMIQ